MRRFEIVLLVLLLLLCPYASASNIYEEQLDRGIRNNEPYSYTLSKKAETSQDKRQLLSDAIRHSPDTPLFYFKLSKEVLPDIFASSDYILDGIKAYKRNFWWRLSLIRLLYVSLLLSFVISVTLVLLIQLPKTIPLIRHEIEENRKKLALLLIVIFCSLLGPLFFIAGVLLITGLYVKRADKVLVYATLLLILFSPIFLRQANILFSASSPELRAIVSVNEGRDTRHAVQTLMGKADFVSRFSYALALKKEGRFEEAIAEYMALADKNDHRVYINMGNAYVGLGEMELAKQSYDRAIAIKKSVAGLYNLSQVYRDTFDFPKGEEYFLQAVNLNRDMVSSFTAITSRSPNRFVMDTTLTEKDYWDIAVKEHREIIRVFAINPLLISLSAVFLIVLFYFIDRKSKHKPRFCARCGSVFCGKCAKRAKADMCSKCYSSFITPTERAPKEKVAILLSIHEQKDKKRKITGMLSFAPPGIAHLYSGKLLIGFIYLWLFMFPLMVLTLNWIFTRLSPPSRYNHSWLYVPALVSIVILYLLSILAIQRRQKKGWL
ncbi:MAG: hypothetical protein HY805_11115 [Nitrospirae bacterium]|nr:hypothetical protein [Nitrospirota bacterium]